MTQTIDWRELSKKMQEAYKKNRKDARKVIANRDSRNKETALSIERQSSLSHAHKN
jgi:hypothetical protein